MCDLDFKIDNGIAIKEEKKDRLSIKGALYQFEKKEVMDLQQKAKIKWRIEGDQNSKYYHGILNHKRKQISIKGINKDGEWLLDASSVRSIYSNYYRDKFKAINNLRIGNPDGRFQKIGDDADAALIRDITMKELNVAVWSCGGNKAPGPNGFNFDFIKCY